MNLGLGLSLGAVRAGGGVAPTALPAEADLSLHFRAQDITPQADNTALASWTDRIASVTITQGTGVNQPLYRTSRTNSLPAVQFTGNTWLTIGRPTQLITPLGQDGNATGFTLFFVVGNLNSPSGDFRTIFSPSNVNNDKSIVLRDNYGGARSERKTIVTSPFQVIMVTGKTLGSARRVEYTFHGNCIRRDDTAYLVGTGDYQLGSATGGTSFGIQADICEWGVYNRALTLAEQYTFIKYACDKYGVAYPWAGLSYFEVFDGDSQTNGTGAVRASWKSSNWADYMLDTNGRPFTSYTNLARPSINTTALTAWADHHYAGLRAAIGLPIIVHGFEYYNQPETNAAGALAWVAAIKAADPDLITCIGSSLDNGQLPGTTFRDNRASFNAAISAPNPNIDVFVPIHTDATVGVEGACPDSPGPYGPNFADIVGHPTNAGYQALAAFWNPYRTTALGLI